MIDLHTHSTASDGLLAPADLVREAAQRGLVALALTDHDTVQGIAEATIAGQHLGIEIVPGVELGTDVREAEVHLLGYFVDPMSPAFLTSLAALAARRRERASRMVERLNDLGIAVTIEEVAAQAGAGSVGRPHIARALVARGAVGDIAEAFDRFLAIGRPAYVGRHPFTPENAIALIRAAGGVAVLAHPLSSGDPAATIVRLLPAGLAGLEVYYGEYDQAARAMLRALADQHGLIPTGGSDFHGPGFKRGRDLGGSPAPPGTIALLRRHAHPSDG